MPVPQCSRPADYQLRSRADAGSLYRYGSVGVALMVLYIVLGVTVAALIVLTVIYFRKKKKEKLAAAAGGEVVAPGGDEISVLIHEAEKKLAAAKLEQGAKLGGLPVFLIVGEPGTTKTSVLLHSGLEPELLSGQVYRSEERRV